MKKKKVKAFTNELVDRIWPRITGQRENCPTVIEFTFEGSEEILLKAEEYAHALAAKAEERETAIDRKLFSLFSLSTVASWVMIAVLIGTATITVPDTTTAPPYLVILAIVLVAYITLQMLITVRNTVKGLQARPYRGATPESVIPERDEDKAKYVARQLNEMMNTTRQNDWMTNRKLDDMKIAHTALANAVWAATGLLVMALGLETRTETPILPKSSFS